jgi:cobalt/nickel transport system permease protein/cobalt/nickel transport protein
VSRVSTRALVVTGLLVALLLAGVVSHYASTSPDGLNRVAQDKGFAQTHTRHHADGSPFAGYGTKGVGDARLSKGVAGVVGSLVVLALAGGVTFLVRRRGPRPGSRDEREPVEHGGR